MGGHLLLLRHGESTLNATSTFTGLLDAPLSPAGEAQVGVAASLVDAAGLCPDLLVTTPMLRARRTADLLLAGLGLVGVPEVVTWRLLERDYGRLTGLAKADARVLLGEEAFFTLRRTMQGRPPAASAEQAASWPLAPVADSGPLVPGVGESLADVVERVGPVWSRTILPALASGRVVFVVAHGNSLRALSAIMEPLADDETERLNIPAGHPLVYYFGPDGLVPRGGRYLDAVAAGAAADQVAAEGGT
jgi:2,3-bisphosphoglycerate-dependent phosphoglycerate mutase